jgi:hypothetical protein
MKKSLNFVLWIIYSKLLVIHTLTDRKIYRPSADELKNPNIYPERSLYGIKAIQADNWKVQDLTGNGVGGVVLNLPW